MTAQDHGEAGVLFEDPLENFHVDQSSGACSFEIPIASDHISISLAYNSRAESGPFGLGWSVPIPSISRKTAKGVPHYVDSDDSFSFDEVGELVHVGDVERKDAAVSQYSARIQGRPMVVEKWVKQTITFWRVITANNSKMLFGTTANSQISHGGKVFSWLLAETEDCRGRSVQYTYEEDGNNRHISAISYGNRAPKSTDWVFSMAFSYTVRKDPFTMRNAGFEIPTTVLCQKITCSHHFAEFNGPFAIFEIVYDDRILPSKLQRVSRSTLGRQMADITLEYTAPTPSNSLEVREFKIDGPTGPFALAEFVDLDGEGAPGLLTEQSHGWYFRSNLSADGVAFGDPRLIDQPGDGTGPMKFDTLDGSGYLAAHTAQGWFPRSFPGWGSFRPFVTTTYAINRYADLTGDGLMDIVILSSFEITWYRCLGVDGYDLPRTVSAPAGFAADDASALVIFADMSGDGMADLVRIADGNVSYWPGFGYCEFGPKVCMVNSPTFAHQGPLDSNRLLVADVNSSGFSSLLYATDRGVDVYQNLGGQAFADRETISVSISPGVSMRIANLRGTGSTCLVWSPFDDPSLIRYIDFAPQRLPNALKSVSTGHGAVLDVEFTSSATFGILDRAKGQDWHRPGIPFPVQCTSRTMKTDLITGASLTKTYAYSNGRYDHSEREFCGFGTVMEITSEKYPDGFTTPEKVLKSWMHTGRVGEVIEWTSGPQFPTPVLGQIDSEDVTDAYRALKGQLLRSEASHGNELIVTAHDYSVMVLERASLGAKAVLRSVVKESSQWHAKGDFADPMVIYESFKEFDEYGNAALVTKKCKGRDSGKLEDYTNSLSKSSQSRDWKLVTKTEFTAVIRGEDAFVSPVPSVKTVTEVTESAENVLNKTIVKYMSDDGKALLSRGKVGELLLEGEVYKLATLEADRDEVLSHIGYVQLEGEPGWWIPSGRPAYDSEESPFFNPVSVTDSFNATTRLRYDEYGLFATSRTDALQNTVKIVYDYGTLQPRLTSDANQNKIQTFFDGDEASGLMLLGEGEPVEDKAVDERDFAAFAADPLSAAAGVLGQRLSRTVSSQLEFSKSGCPNFRWEIERVDFSEESDVCISVTYYDGLGRLLQTRRLLDSRWLVEKQHVLSVSGETVKTFKSWFSDTHAFSPSTAFPEIELWDWLGRHVGKVRSGAWSKTVHDVWKRTEYSPGNLARYDPAEDPHIKELVRGRGISYSVDASSLGENAPTVRQFDSMGRSVATVEALGSQVQRVTSYELDAQGRVLLAVDPKGRRMQSSVYDMGGREIRRQVIDCAEVSTTYDARDNAATVIDGRGFRNRLSHDAIGRVTEVYVSGLDESSSGEFLSERFVYGEGKGHNLNGRLYESYDQSGLYRHAYDFRGNLTSTTVSLSQSDVVDWSDASRVSRDLEPEVLESSFEYDALGRQTTRTYIDGTRAVTKLDRLGNLTALSVAGKDFVVSAEHNESRQLSLLRLGNGTVVEYDYDDATGLLAGIKATSSRASVVQDLQYVHDVSGNLIRSRDQAQQDLLVRGDGTVGADCDYSYDSLGQLLTATGREFARNNSLPRSVAHGTLAGQDEKDGERELARYDEEYSYDECGNIMSVIHKRDSQVSWSRQYEYTDDGNLLKSTSTATALESTSEKYTYDHGYTTSVLSSSGTGLASLAWNHQGRLQSVSERRGDAEKDATTSYVYNSGGDRVRQITKVDGKTLRSVSSIDDMEILQPAGQLDIAEKTLSVLVGGLHLGQYIQSPGRESKFLYQLHNVVGSSVIDLSEDESIVAYEEYAPFGSTTVAVGDGARKFGFEGKRRDEETGMYHFHEREYMASVGRWLSPDPMLFIDGPNLYHFVGNNPTTHVDLQGTMKEVAAKLNYMQLYQGMRHTVASPSTALAVMRTPTTDLYEKVLQYEALRPAFQAIMPVFQGFNVQSGLMKETFDFLKENPRKAFAWIYKSFIHNAKKLNDNYGDEREKFNPHTTKVARVLEHDRRKTESDAKTSRGIYHNRTTAAEKKRYNMALRGRLAGVFLKDILNSKIKREEWNNNHLAHSDSIFKLLDWHRSQGHSTEQVFRAVPNYVKPFLALLDQGYGILMHGGRDLFPDLQYLSPSKQQEFLKFAVKTYGLVYAGSMEAWAGVNIDGKKGRAVQQNRLGDTEKKKAEAKGRKAEKEMLKNVKRTIYGPDGSWTMDFDVPAAQNRSSSSKQRAPASGPLPHTNGTPKKRSVVNSQRPPSGTTSTPVQPPAKPLNRPPPRFKITRLK